MDAKEGRRARKSPKQAGGPKQDEPDATALFNLERIRQQEAELSRRAAAYQTLLAEHELLAAQKAEDDRESVEATAFFREELLAKNAEVEALQREVESLQQMVAEAAAAAEAREQERAAGWAAERVVLEEKHEALQAQLDGLQEFQQRRAELEEDTAALRLQLQKQSMEQADQVAALQQQLAEAAARAAAAEEASSNGDEAVEPGSGRGEARRALAQNRKMGEQMKAYAEEAEQLQAGVRALEKQHAALLRDAQLREEMERQYALRGTQQAREIKDAASKISSLERGIADLAASAEAERAALAGELRGQLAAALAEQETLRRLLKLRTKELQQVRARAHEVLLQRSEVEAFLLSAIQQVRLEIARERSSAAEDGRPEVSQLQLEEAMVASSTVDIRELSWGDRERVLRQLFLRINSNRRRVPPPAPPLRGACTEAGPARLA